MSGSKFAKKIFIDRLPWHVASDDIYKYFSKFGLIRYVRVPFDKETGYHRGYGFIMFGHNKTAETVIKEEHILGNVKVRVNLSLENKRK